MRMNDAPIAADPRLRAAEEALAGLASAIGSLRCAGSQRLVRLGISMTHFHVLTLLRHHDAMPMGRLAEILDASMSSATGVIDRMEEKGLVERVRVPDDRRVVLVRPTQAGIDLVNEAELVRSEVMHAALARLTVEQLDRLAASTVDLAAALGAEVASDPDHYAPAVPCTHPPTPHAPDPTLAAPDQPADRRSAPAAGTAS
jgi:DNA-binding MarR family transcriptional regulator